MKSIFKKSLILESGGGVRAGSLSRFEFFPQLEDKKVNNSISSPLWRRGIAKAPYLTTKGFKSGSQSSRGNFFNNPDFSKAYVNVMNSQFLNNVISGMQRRTTYLIFVILVTLTRFEAEKCYTQKCVNL